MRVIPLLIAAALVGCTSYQGPYHTYLGPTERHQVVFDNFNYSPDYSILTYRYALQNKPILEGTLGANAGVVPFLLPRSMANYPRGDSLYVRWVHRPSGTEFERAIPLTAILPASLDNKQLLIVPEDSKVSLYVLGPKTTEFSRENCVTWLNQHKRVPKVSDLAVKALNCDRPVYQIYPERQSITGVSFNSTPRRGLGVDNF